MTYENQIDKSRIWLAVTYPENMRQGWEEDCDEILQLPFAYCIHNGDRLKAVAGQKAEGRKVHVHFILVFKNTTTRKHALAVINLLSEEGKQCCPGVKACLDVRQSWDYLIHDTPNARKKGKELYPPEARITGNCFDIGAYEQLSQDEKDQMIDELLQFAKVWNIRDMSDFYSKMREAFDWRYFEVFRTANAMIDRVCRGNDLQAKRRQMTLKAPECAFCGSKFVAGSYDTEKGKYWYCADERCQQAAYTVCEEQGL